MADAGGVVRWMVVGLAVSMCSMPQAGWAQGESTQATETKTESQAAGAEKAAESPQAPQPTPASDVPVPPALKPITITFSGTVTALNLEGNPPTVTVQDRYQVKKEIEISPTTKVSQGATSLTPKDLKTGSTVTVEYTYDVATGKRVAQSISVGEGASAAR